LTGFDDNETKLPTYWSTSFEKICLGMKVGNKTNFITIDMSKNSLYECLADGRFRGVTVKWKHWRRLLEKPAIQDHCKREGFNVKGDENPTPFAKVAKI
jgi:hypothetical protein